MPTNEIIFEAGNTQQAFITSRAEADLFACRMGEGKSAALVWSLYYYTLHNPGAIGAIIRDTWENLRDTTQKEFFYWFPPGVAGEWKASTKTWTWRLGDLRGEVMFLGMDDEKDAHKLQSRPLSIFAMDEPAPAAGAGGIDEFIFSTGMTRLRVPGMKWYSAKLAENNPDEGHWTYKLFVDPGYAGTPEDVELPPEQKRGYKVFQTVGPENLENLPAGYYERLEKQYERTGRLDLRDRFARGQFGFQQPGLAVTPQFNETIHVRNDIEPLDTEIKMLWDFGLNATCVFTQVTPMGHWNILEAYVGDGDVGVYELISGVVAPRMKERFRGLAMAHYGDPQGKQREQSSSEQSAVRVIRNELGGPWRPGPTKWEERRDPLCKVLTVLRNGTGLVQIDRKRARTVWHALRGGWHYKKHKNDVVSVMPVKDIHSHPGDAMGYGAAVIFPRGELHKKILGGVSPNVPGYQFGRRNVGPFGWEQPGLSIPQHGDTIDPPEESR